MASPNRSERVELAALIGKSEQYLYQCLTGRREMDATLAARLERLSSGRILRRQLRRDWRETWPELTGVEATVSEGAHA